MSYALMMTASCAAQLMLAWLTRILRPFYASCVLVKWVDGPQLTRVPRLPLPLLLLLLLLLLLARS